jgi:hypothetical protein
MSEVNDVVADLRALADAGFGAGHYGPAMKRGADLIAHQAARLEEVTRALQAADATLTGRDAFALDPIVGSDNPHEHAAGLVRAALSEKEQTDV